MQLAEQLDEMVLFSGESDFRPLVAAMQRQGVRVTVVSSVACQPPMIADDLRRQADVFIDLSELQHKLGRVPAEQSKASETRPLRKQVLRSKPLA